MKGRYVLIWLFRYVCYGPSSSVFAAPPPHQGLVTKCGIYITEPANLSLLRVWSSHLWLHFLSPVFSTHRPQDIYIFLNSRKPCLSSKWGNFESLLIYLLLLFCRHESIVTVFPFGSDCLSYICMCLFISLASQPSSSMEELLALLVSHVSSPLTWPKPGCKIRDRVRWSTRACKCFCKSVSM